MSPTLATAVQTLRDVPRAGYRESGDAALIELTRLAGEARRLADLHVTLATGELARRSSHRSGSTGLVQREGARTVEEYVSTATGMTGRDAAVAVRIGRLTAEGGTLGTRVADGSVSVPAADAIRAGLSGADASPESIAHATALLCDEAPQLGPDRLLARAREVRDELDDEGIAGREATLRARRSLRRFNLRDGMKRLVWDYDPETAGVVDEV